MDGRYEIGFGHIRSLAIQAHALDVQFDKLFNSTTICEKSEAIQRAYNRLLSTTLLNLAISVRVDLSDELLYRERGGRFAAAGLFLEGGPQQGGGQFSVKDICDKIIHADRIFKPIEPGVQGAGCELQGKYHGNSWRFGLGVRIFSECILQWVDELDAIQCDPPVD